MTPLETINGNELEVLRIPEKNDIKHTKKNEYKTPHSPIFAITSNKDEFVVNEYSIVEYAL
jgi:hypothetical protein